MTQPRIEIYTTRSCPFCHRAKALLNEKGVAFEETDVADPDLRARMMQRAGGKRSVPQIFIDGRHVGGCDDIHALDRAGKLDPMLQGAA